MVDLTQYREGIDAARAASPQICRDPRQAFMDIIIAEGFSGVRNITPEKFQRYDTPDCKRGKIPAWSMYHEIETDGGIIGHGTYGNFQTGFTQSWSSVSENRMDTAERAKYHAQREAMKAQREDEERYRQVEAAKKAFEIWSNAPDAKEHPYLEKKGVNAHTGLKAGKDGRLIIPIAVNSEITSLQYINNDGEKRFLTGGKIKGGWFIIEGEDDVIYIAEGYSTAKSVHEATGKTVYTAFNAGNLYEVSSYVRNAHMDRRVVIAGDDDVGTAGNAGRTKAEQAAQGLGIEAIFPQGFIDFNDMHAAKGIEALSDYLNPKNLQPYEAPKKKEGDAKQRPEGVLGSIYDYYNVTSGNDQRGFAIQTALACTSLILGRSFKTNYDNYTSLFFLNVGETATGKEHAKTVFEKIMYKTGNGMYVAGDGYTSDGAVMSSLLRTPKHGTCSDELGKYLEASSGKNGGGIQAQANRMLMECFGRCDGIVRAKNYSTMTMKKSDADNIANRTVYNPAITWIAMTTPSTLFKAIDIEAVKDGFINRFIISISSAEPVVRRHKEPVDVPDSIMEWAKAIQSRSKLIHIAGEEVNAIVLPITKEADDAQIEFQEELLVTRKKLKKYSMEGLAGRANEEAMRVSLNYALSKDPHAQFVDLSSMEWAINYVRDCLNDTINMLKMTISHSGHEADKKEILADLRRRGSYGITWADMQKTPPYSQHKPKDLKEIMQSLKDAELAGDEAYQPPKGRATVKWIPLK